MAAQAPSPCIVLVVDPRSDEREMYCQYLSSLGFVVAQARDGRSALSQVELLTPAVVTTELRLPGVDGFALCHLLKDAHPAIHMIAVTAQGYPDALARARLAGFDAVLVKPCLPSRIVEEIHSLTAGAQVH